MSSQSTSIQTIHCNHHPSIHFLYPSIHFLYPLNPILELQGASRHWARGRVHPGQVASPSQGHSQTNETNDHTLTPRDNLETPINPKCLFLEGGRKPEYPERTHTYTGKHVNSTQKGLSWESYLEPFCCEPTLLTTVQPNHNPINYIQSQFKNNFLAKETNRL